MQRQISRRELLLSLGAAGLAASAAAADGGRTVSEPRRAVRFGVIADPHRDLVPDSMERLGAFVEAVERERPSFVIHLGDFCQPKPANLPFLELWNSCDCPRHHVLGNHDMDGGFAREDTVAWYGMPGRHYSWDEGPVHFVVLDGNDPGPEQSPYYRYVGPEQLRWLEADLATTVLPSIVFSHQPLASARNGVANAEAVRAVLTAAPARVLACLAGHLHLDYAQTLSGIHYVMINSMSYQWLGEAYRHERYGEAVDSAFPWIRCTAPFREPLWAWITLDLDEGTLRVEGRESAWVGPSPDDLGFPRDPDAGACGPRITDRVLRPAV